MTSDPTGMIGLIALLFILFACGAIMESVRCQNEMNKYFEQLLNRHFGGCCDDAACPCNRTTEQLRRKNNAR